MHPFVSTLHDPDVLSSVILAPKLGSVGSDLQDDLVRQRVIWSRKREREVDYFFLKKEQYELF